MASFHALSLAIKNLSGTQVKVCGHCKHIFSSGDWSCPSCGCCPALLGGIDSHAPESAYGGDGFKPAYFSDLYRVEAENFWFRARNELIIWALQAYKAGANSFLEVGCGTGFVLSGLAKAYPGLALSGSDIFIQGLSRAKKRVPSAHFMQMDARWLPFVEEFDAIGAFDVLEHIKDDERVLAQLYNAITPDGILLLTVPQHPSLWSSSDEYACHVRRYRCSEIEQKVLTVGFEILRSSSFVTSLLPAMMISRVLQNENSAGFDPGVELKINPILNASFYALMKLEILGIKFGINYPVGGSRLIVAKKRQ